MKPCWSVKQWSLWQPCPLPSSQYSQTTVSLGLGCHSPSLLCSPGADQLASRLRDVKAAAQWRYSQRSAHIGPAERPAASRPSPVQATPSYANNSISLASADEMGPDEFWLLDPSRKHFWLSPWLLCENQGCCVYMHYVVIQCQTKPMHLFSYSLFVFAINIFFY